MCKTVAYMRISTKEERGKQKFTRQEQAIARWCKENNTAISDRKIYKDDASGKSFNRQAWKELESDIQPGDTIVFKDICRFTRNREEGYAKYKDFLDKDINLIFIDNPTVSTDYIKQLLQVAKEQSIVAQTALESTVKLLLIVELDRAEKEREITVQRIKDGIASSDKASGRPVGTLDKMTDGLRQDIREFLTDRTIKQVDLMKRHNISRNTLKKYIELVKQEI